MFRRISKRDRPEKIEKIALVQEERLRRALEVASSRASRSSETIRALFASAKVSGRAPKSDIKAAVVSFKAPPFLGGLHHFYPWEYLDTLSQRELAADVSRTLRSRLALRLKEGV